MDARKRALDLLGALTATALIASAGLIFTFRLVGLPQLGFWLGWLEFSLAFPLVYLLIKAPSQKHSLLYYLQISIMLLFLGVEAVLDYLLRLDFRQDLSLVIPYVTLFFAGIGGMVGLASHAGRRWTILAGILFLVTAALAFIQRAVTGL